MSTNDPETIESSRASSKNRGWSVMLVYLGADFRIAKVWLNGVRIDIEWSAFATDRPASPLLMYTRLLVHGGNKLRVKLGAKMRNIYRRFILELTSRVSICAGWRDVAMRELISNFGFAPQ